MYTDINLNNYAEVYDYDSDTYVIDFGTSLPESISLITDDIKSISLEKLFDLGVRNIKTNLDLNLSMTREATMQFNRIETTGNIDLHDSYLNCKSIECDVFDAFASSVEFNDIKANSIKTTLTEVIGSVNNSVSSHGFVHTDNGIVLDKSKFTIVCPNIKGIKLV